MSDHPNPGLDLPMREPPQKGWPVHALENMAIQGEMPFLAVLPRAILASFDLENRGSPHTTNKQTNIISVIF